MSKKYLYYFSEGNDAFGGDKVTMKNILGGKGAGLAEMTAAGMPVPQGFTITTEACTQYYADGRQINDEITADIFEHVKGLEKITGKTFGDNENPLAGFNRVNCWVHYYLILGIIVTVIYGAGVLVRRINFTRKLKGFENDVLGIEDEQAAAPFAAPFATDGREA